jgi:molybdopterin converting factor small subunit
MTATSDSFATVRVLLFASYAERMGRDAVELRIARGTTVGSVLARIRALPGGDQLPPRPLCALNLAHVGPEAPVSPGDEIAILPPLAGG